ncbi:hypothetical protein [Neobacillus vireti]
MKNINQFPKSIVKAVRYIKQEAPKEKLQEIKYILESAINLRNKKFD